MLKSHFSGLSLEAGCDEAGRGCLAGPVFAAAVIFPKDYTNTLMDDSKKLSERKRAQLRYIIEKEALAFAVEMVDNNEIDKINILNASILAMHKALQKLNVKPMYIIVDGNRFKPYLNIPYTCIVKGDGKFLSIAAASILAKTYRDEYMEKASEQFPEYNWSKNKGYPTLEHRKILMVSGLSPLHRRSFSIQLKLWEK